MTRHKKSIPNRSHRVADQIQRDVAELIRDPRIAAVTLTGSERAGRAVAAVAGEALKKCVLELGGSDAFIVASSANLDDVIPFAVTARVQNNGQSCIASKRFIVVDSLYDEFVARFSAAMSEVVVGDPMNPATVVGPLVSAAQRDLLSAQVNDAVAKGAGLLAGGTVQGRCFAATVLAGVTADMRVFREESFGPFASIVTVDSAEEALRESEARTRAILVGVWNSVSAILQASMLVSSLLVTAMIMSASSAPASWASAWLPEISPLRSWRMQRRPQQCFTPHRVGWAPFPGLISTRSCPARSPLSCAALSCGD